MINTRRVVFGAALLLGAACFGCGYPDADRGTSSTSGLGTGATQGGTRYSGVHGETAGIGEGGVATGSNGTTTTGSEAANSAAARSASAAGQNR